MALRDIPNLITFMRMVLVLPVVWALLEREFALAFFLFGIAGFSDALDGFLAKRYNWTSEMGGWLDPVADKLLLVTSFIALGYLQLIPVWLVVMALIRDLIIFSGALAYHYLVKKFEGEPSVLSKLNTLLQIMLVVVVVFSAWTGWPDDGVIALGVWAVAAVVVASGVQYIVVWSKRSIQELRRQSS